MFTVNVAENHTHYKRFKIQSSLKGLSCKRVKKTNNENTKHASQEHVHTHIEGTLQYFYK